MCLISCCQVWARRCVSVTNPESESLCSKDSITVYSLKSPATGQGFFVPYRVSLLLIAPWAFQKHKRRTRVICAQLFACLSPTGCYFHALFELYFFLGRKRQCKSMATKRNRNILTATILLSYYPGSDTRLNSVMIFF